MSCYTSHIDFVTIAQRINCSICKNVCEINEEMAKHVCGCGCGGFNMCCLNCPLRKIFQPVQCRKERQQPKFNTNEKHLLKKNN